MASNLPKHGDNLIERSTDALGNEKFSAKFQFQQFLDDLSRDIVSNSNNVDQIEKNRLAIIQNAIQIAINGNEIDANTQAIINNALAIAQNSADILNRTFWKGIWTEGTYQNKWQVNDVGWLMIANKETTDRAAPQPIGAPATTLPDAPAWISKDDTSLITAGNTYTITEGGWVMAARVWAPAVGANTRNRVIFVDWTDLAAPLVTYIDDPVLNTNDWTTVAIGQKLAPAGSVFSVYLQSLTTSGVTPWSGVYVYAGDKKNDDPQAGEWYRDKDKEIRVSKTDDDGTDQSANLAASIPGTIFRFGLESDLANFREYATTEDGVDEGSFYSFRVTREDQGGGNLGGQQGERTDLAAVIPIPAPTKYVEEIDYWLTNQPDWATIAGVIEFDGVDQGQQDSAFGTDILFQRADVSDDWDFQSYTAGGVEQSPNYRAVEVTADYQVLVSDYVVISDGNNTITLPDIEYAKHSVTIASDTGTVTVVGNAAIQGSSSVSALTSVTWHPTPTKGWRR